MKPPVLADPFAPEADPDPPDSRVSRRELAALLAAGPAVTWLSGCVGPRLACAPQRENATSCQHRFCRYFRAPAGDPGVGVRRD
jgi:hypothetical protein